MNTLPLETRKRPFGNYPIAPRWMKAILFFVKGKRYKGVTVKLFRGKMYVCKVEAQP